MLYDVPKKPLRPTDQGMVYTGHVAHTKASPDGGGKDDDEAPSDAGAGPDEPTFQKSGPVEPIAPVTAPAAVTTHAKDGGSP
jgi:hypothetical protein